MPLPFPAPVLLLPPSDDMDSDKWNNPVLLGAECLASSFDPDPDDTRFMSIGESIELLPPPPSPLFVRRKLPAPLPLELARIRNVVRWCSAPPRSSSDMEEMSV